MMQTVESEVAADLVHRIRQGDAAAESELVERYSRGLYFLLRRISRPPELAEDLRQEAFQVVLERLRGKGLDEPAKLGEFLRGTARNLALVELRRKVRRSSETLDAVEEPVERSASQFDRLVVEERMRLVHRLISELHPERDRQLLYRFYIAEEDKEDICRDLDLSAAHFNRVLFRARQRFKDLLERFEKRQRFRESTTVHLVAGALLVFGILVAARPPAADGQPVQVLRPDVPIEREIEGGQSHVYLAELPSAGPWLVTVEQKGANLVLAARGTDDRRAGPVDAPTFRRLTESLVLPAGFAMDGGEARIEVSSRYPADGRGLYAIRLRELSAKDPERLAAETAMSEAGRSYFLSAQTEPAEGDRPPAAFRDEAAGKYEEALVHWRSLGDRRGEARCLVALGALASEAGRTEQALELYESARPLLAELDDVASEAMVVSNLGLAHWRLGHDEEAGEWLTEALVLQKRAGNRYGEAVAQNNLCLRAHSQGRLRKAAECYQEALKTLRELGELGHESVLLSNLGAVYQSLGEPELALDYHERALAIRRSTGNRSQQGRTLNNLAVLDVDLGATEEAARYYREALEIFRETGEAEWEARTLSNLGALYLGLGESRRAEAFFRQALPMRRETGNRRGEAATLNSLGSALARRGETAAARALYQEALNLAREISYRGEEARALELLGRTFMDLGDFSPALDFFDEDLVAARAMNDRLREANAVRWKGEAETALGRTDDALVSLGQALELYRAVGDRPGEARALRALARAERGRGRLHEARQRLEESLEIVESVRTWVLSPSLRAAILESHRETYELLVDTLAELHAAEPGQGYAERAFEVSERARARTLVELLEEAGVDRDQAGEALLGRRRSLERRLSAKVARQIELAAEKKDDGEQAALEAERYEITAELEEVEAEIRRASPRPSLARTLSVGEVRSLLDPDTVLLEYILGEKRSFLWRVDAVSTELFELAPKAEIEAAARRVHEAFSTLDLRARESDAEAAAALSRLVLGPVAGELGERRLVIAADGALHYVPFGALPLPEASTSPELILEHHEVVYLPSASTLAALRREAAARSASKWVAVVGDPVFGPGDPRTAAASLEPPATLGGTGGTNAAPPGGTGGTNAAPPGGTGGTNAAPPGGTGGTNAAPEAPLERSVRGLGLSELERLPYTRREARAIAGLAAPGEVLLALGFEANRSTVMGGALRDYRIVHFATHGLVNDRDPELSGLVLSLVDEAGRAQDGFLRLRDIYSLELDADLVVLSGCRTALGPEVRGEGLWGLTRGFLHTGVPRVVASLWQVEDQATAELMARFYGAMKLSRLPAPPGGTGGTTAAAALRRAQLELRAERSWRDPYYWAAFLLQGDWR